MQCFQYRLSYPDGGVRPRGGATVVFLEAENHNGAWYYGVTGCSLLDNFCKQRGVFIAQGRAEKMVGVFTGPIVGNIRLTDRGVFVGSEDELPDLADQLAAEAICRAFQKAIRRSISPFVDQQDAQLLLTIHPSFCYVKCGDGYRFRITDIDRAEFEEVE